MRWPSGCQATQKTRPAWPANSATHLSGLRVPDRRGRAEAGRDDLRPSGLTATLQTSSPCCRRSVFPGSRHPERCRVPDADRPIRAGRGQAQAVGTERHAPAQARCARGGRAAPGRSRVPDAHDLVLADRGEQAVRAEGDAQDEPPDAGACEGADRSSCPTRPPGGRSWPRPAACRRAESQRGDGVASPGVGVRCAEGRPPPPRRTVSRCRPVPRRQVPPVAD